MIFDKEGTTTTVTQETVTLVDFISKLTSEYPKLKNDNLIINLFSFDKFTTNDVLEFLDIAKSHTALQKSFVLVSNKVDFNSIPEEICVVPTLQEAKDIIEMEEIERDLGI